MKMMPSGVGIFETKVVLFSRDKKRRQTLRLIVDTGSTYTWVPEEVAKQLGLRPSGTWKFRTVDGREVARPICDAYIECDGRGGVARTVLARGRDFQILGMTTLETLGLEMDARAGVLRKADASLAVAPA